MTGFINIDPDFSISEVVLEESNKQGFIKELIINEFDDGFFITAKLAWSGQKVWTLTTRREKDKARIFKDLTRLNDERKNLYRRSKNNKNQVKNTKVISNMIYFGLYSLKL
mgnify:CR=1 FL=1